MRNEPRGDAERLEWEQSPESGARPIPDGAERSYPYRGKCSECGKWSAISVPAEHIEKAGSRRIEELEAELALSKEWTEALEKAVRVLYRKVKT